MSQTWDIDLISPATTSPSTDITRITDGFDTLRSIFSGTSEPAVGDQVAYMLWADTTTGLLKQRNAANSAWVSKGLIAAVNFGAIGNTLTAKSALFTVVAADNGIIYNCTATWTMSLTAAATLGSGFLFGVINSGAGVVTVDPNSTETIDGATTMTVSPGQRAIIACNGTSFFTVSLANMTVGKVTAATGSFVLPSGTTGQRDASPAAAYIRYNSTTSSFEGYTSAWGSIGGGATGAGGDTVFQENQLIVTTSYTLTTGKSAMSVGPITLNSGVVVTIPSGYRWLVL